MSRFPRFLRVALLPIAVLAMVAGSSASASAAILDTGTSTTPVSITISAPTSVIGKIKPLSMNW